jgi:hypothetical protein
LIFPRNQISRFLGPLKTSYTNHQQSLRKIFLNNDSKQ